MSKTKLAEVLRAAIDAQAGTAGDDAMLARAIQGALEATSRSAGTGDEALATPNGRGGIPRDTDGRMRVEVYDSGQDLVVANARMAVVPRVGEFVTIRHERGSTKFEVTGVLYTLDSDEGPPKQPTDAFARVVVRPA